jgi:hypothetical protein
MYHHLHKTRTGCCQTPADVTDKQTKQSAKQATHGPAKCGSCIQNLCSQQQTAAVAADQNPLLLL